MSSNSINNNFNNSINYDEMTIQELVMASDQYPEIKDLIFRCLPYKDLLETSLACKNYYEIALAIFPETKKEEQIQKFFKLYKSDFSEQDIRKRMVFSKNQIFSKYKKFLLELKNNEDKVEPFICFFINEEANTSSQLQLIFAAQIMGKSLDVNSHLSIKDYINEDHCLIIPKFVWKTTPNDFMQDFKTDYKKEIYSISLGGSQHFPIPGTGTCAKVVRSMKITPHDGFKVSLFDPRLHITENTISEQNSSGKSEEK